MGNLLRWKKASWRCAMTLRVSSLVRLGGMLPTTPCRAFMLTGTEPHESPRKCRLESIVSGGAQYNRWRRRKSTPHDFFSSASCRGVVLK